MTPLATSKCLFFIVTLVFVLPEGKQPEP